MTIRELFDRYLREITPAKRSSSSESYRIKAMMTRSIAHRTLATLGPQHVAEYRDERLAVVSEATVIRELNSLAHPQGVA